MIKRSFRRLRKAMKGFRKPTDNERAHELAHRFIMYWVEKEPEIVAGLSKIIIGGGFVSLIWLYRELDKEGGSPTMEFLRDLGLIKRWRGRTAEPLLDF